MPAEFFHHGASDRNFAPLFGDENDTKGTTHGYAEGCCTTAGSQIINDDLSIWMLVGPGKNR